MSSAKIKPRLPKGFRDFLPATMLKREYVLGIVVEMFQRYGFEPLQTPVLELNETLYGKYGEDAENLIFNAQHGRSTSEALAMRYDLTVPLARVVAQYESEINLPFKRYHIAPVWRGERPQRGRYREFYQCDADIVGVSGMQADAEIIRLLIAVLTRLGFPQFSVKINNRKLLTSIAQYSGVVDEQLADLYRSIDKFDKIGAEGVEKELVERGIDNDVVTRMMTLIQSREPGLANLDVIERAMGHIPEAAEGLAELRDIAENLDLLGADSNFYEFDFTMVRGLSYYTGPIFETVITEPNLGSITGGGRYDGLIGLFRRESLPTVGSSLGIERIIDLMDILELYPTQIGGTVVEVLVTVFDEERRAASSRLAASLRDAGIRTELMLDDRKLGKQFNYADKKGIPMVATIGPDEAAQNQVKLKRLRDGHEMLVAFDAVAEAVDALRD